MVSISRKKYSTIILLFLCFYINVYFGYCVCSDYPNSIKIVSGTNLVGEFSYVDIATQSVYIKSNLKNNPLKIEMNYGEIDNDCFTSNENVKFKLFSSGAEMPANSIGVVGNKTIVTFNFDFDISTPESFTSNYITYTKSNPSGSMGNIYFKTDTEKPQLLLTYQPMAKIINPNTTIKIDYIVSDYHSGLESLIISNGYSKLVNFDGNKSYSSFLSEKISTSKTYLFRVKDVLGNEQTGNVSFIVDNTLPQLNNLKTKAYSRNSNGDRFVSFSMEVSDNSFEMVDEVPVVEGDFSTINSAMSSVRANCIKDPVFDNKYICTWSSIPIKDIFSTTIAPITVTVQDSLNNVIENNYNIEVFYDNEGPQIKEFYLENGVGVRNKFSAFDNNTKIYLNFQDASIEDNIRIITDFDGLENYEYFISPECEYSQDGGQCIWTLGEHLRKYAGEPFGDVTFKITLVDVYGNPTISTLNLTFDNAEPVITKIDFDETEDIQDKIIKSKEKINFRMYIKIENDLRLNSDFIYADFSSVSDSGEMNKVGGGCGMYNDTTYYCDFDGIVMGNGYRNRSAYFIVIDETGNRAIKKFNVEVFKIGDESPNVFKIKPVNITNVLNRNKITIEGSDAWFEGHIETKTETGSGEEYNPSDFKIVNYQLKSCNDSDMLPLLLDNRKLYPDELVIGDGTQEPDRHFILKVEVKTHTNMVDMKDKDVSCKMSVLKRTNDTVFTPEIVDFKIHFSFYDLPYDNLLKAEAKTILEIIDEAEKVGSWFDDVYKIYNYVNTGCNAITSIDNILATVNNVWVPISVVLRGIGYTTAVAQYGDSSLMPIFGTVSQVTHNDYVKKICDWVTCRNGGFLGQYWAGTDIGKTVSSGKDWLNGITTDSICQFNAAGDLSTKFGKPSSLESTSSANADADKVGD